LKGYLTGLYLFNGSMLPEIKLEHVPLFCYYNEIGNEKFMTEKEFEKSLKLTSPTNKKRQRAKKFLEKLKIGESVIFHHIPRI
jgi:hypothetical protein